MYMYTQALLWNRIQMEMQQQKSEAFKQSANEVECEIAALSKVT